MKISTVKVPINNLSPQDGTDYSLTWGGWYNKSFNLDNSRKSLALFSGTNSLLEVGNFEPFSSQLDAISGGSIRGVFSTAKGSLTPKKSNTAIFDRGSSNQYFSFGSTMIPRVFTQHHSFQPAGRKGILNFPKFPKVNFTADNYRFPWMKEKPFIPKLNLNSKTQLVTVDDSTPSISVLWDRALQQAVINSAPGLPSPLVPLVSYTPPCLMLGQLTIQLRSRLSWGMTYNVQKQRLLKTIKWNIFSSRNLDDFWAICLSEG